jgi:XTP/dITP diphosphohydrolase
MMQLRSAAVRDAQFVCTLVVFDPEGKEHVINGIVKGKISDKVRGTTGFGYDPVFIPEGHDKTFSELGIAVKNQLSHRGAAIRDLAKLMQV